jgi:hypothetical protein
LLIAVRERRQAAAFERLLYFEICLRANPHFSAKAACDLPNNNGRF